MVAELIGTWKLLHCKLRNAAGGELPDPFGDASGIITYDNKGYMAAQMMRKGHPVSLPKNVHEATDKEFRDAFNNYIAYYGTYTVNEGAHIVTHKVEGSLWPNMVGLEVSRNFIFKDKNTIVLSTIKPETLATAEPIMRYLTWARVI